MATAGEREEIMIASRRSLPCSSSSAGTKHIAHIYAIAANSFRSETLHGAFGSFCVRLCSKTLRAVMSYSLFAFHSSIGRFLSRMSSLSKIVAPLTVTILLGRACHEIKFARPMNSKKIISLIYLALIALVKLQYIN
jgi:hypothetical protein